MSDPVADVIADAGDAWWRLRTPFTDEDVANLMATQLADRLCFVPTLGWHTWHQDSPDAGVWRVLGVDARAARGPIADQVSDWVDAIRTDASAWAQEDATQKAARKYMTFGSINAMILALTAKLSVEIDGFDRCPTEMNTPAGVYDLLTGDVRPTLPADRHRKLANLTPNPDLVKAIRDGIANDMGIIDAYAEALCDLDIDAPRWFKFLVDTFGTDDELATYVWRLIGGCCVGDGPQEMLHIAIGSGANGKSVLWNTVTWMLGGDGPESYAAAAGSDTLIQDTFNSGRGAHSLWTAIGCRMLFFPELPSGKVDEAMIKGLASGEPMLLNRKFMDEILWRNTGKLIAHTNIEPRVAQGRDGGLWRRMRLVPHNNVVPLDRQDVALQKGFGLSGIERTEIASWIAAAAEEYAAHGIGGIPESVRAATGEYRESEDHLGRFIYERLLVAKGSDGVKWTTPCTSVFKVWQAWCETQNLHPGSQSKFTRDLKNHTALSKSVVHHRANTGYVWVGLAINADDRAADDNEVPQQGEF